MELVDVGFDLCDLVFGDLQLSFGLEPHVLYLCQVAGIFLLYLIVLCLSIIPDLKQGLLIVFVKFVDVLLVLADGGQLLFNKVIVLL